jgi:hypothetical protein
MWGDKVCNFANFGRTNMIQVSIIRNAISDLFSTLDFPSSVFLVKMCLVVVVFLALF